jgi:hypothetical protein
MAPLSTRSHVRRSTSRRSWCLRDRPSLEPTTWSLYTTDACGMASGSESIRTRWSAEPPMRSKYAIPGKIQPRTKPERRCRSRRRCVDGSEHCCGDLLINRDRCGPQGVAGGPRKPYPDASPPPLPFLHITGSRSHHLGLWDMVLDWSARREDPCLDRYHARRADSGLACASRPHHRPHRRVLPARPAQERPSCGAWMTRFRNTSGAHHVVRSAPPSKNGVIPVPSWSKEGTGMAAIVGVVSPEERQRLRGHTFPQR